MFYNIGEGIFSLLFKRDKMNTIEYEEEQYKEANKFPMIVYPKSQNWDGKNIAKIKSISVANEQELKKIKSEVFLDWKDLLKKPKAKKKTKA
tara:strand:+ start:562 stop:837 length:276 start_codon:yes stop_codon:yes gene_type:complete